MTYRWPIFVGDRVATAPHTDLFMAGFRFGTVAEVVVNEENERRYRLREFGRGDQWVTDEDILGAVNARPGGYRLDVAPVAVSDSSDTDDGGVFSATFDLIDPEG